MMSFSFFFSAAVMAVRVRSLLDPTPHPCNQTSKAMADVRAAVRLHTSHRHRQSQ